MSPVLTSLISIRPLLVAMLFALRASTVHADDAPPDMGISAHDLFESLAKIRVEGTTLHYDGYINEGSVAEAERVAKTAPINAPIRTLIVHSRGGIADFAIPLGEFVRDRKLSVVVDRACMSACANYVALPAAQLSVPDSALLGFHGGMPRTFEASGEYSQAYRDNLRSHGMSDTDIANQLLKDKALYARQEALLQSVGVSPAILEDTARRNGTTARLVWMFTRQVLERCYHVTNIKQYPDLQADEIVYGRSVAKVIKACPSSSR